MIQPLIVRVLMSRDWNDAFRLVWAESFKAAAAEMGIPASQVDIAVSNLPSWADRRAVCLRMGARCAEDHDLPELACSWTALAVDPAWPKGYDAAPERRKMFLPVNFALGDAIAEDSSLLDDIDFARTVMGWRLMEAFGIDGPEPDPIVVGRTAGAGMDVDRNELFHWALKWCRGGESA